MSEGEDDVFMGDEMAGSPGGGLAGNNSFFRRGLTSSSNISRLSALIRRSLRLPSRSSASFSAHKRTIVSKDDESGPRFTEYSDLRMLTFPAIPSRLEDIRENRRLARVKKVKQIVRKANWPARHDVRKELWKELCRDKSFDASVAVFNDEMSQVLSDARAHSPSFLAEAGCVVNTYFLTEDGAVRLARMLAIIEQLRPDISCAPILYPLCALFMHYMRDQEAYACAQFLARRGQGGPEGGPVHVLMTRVQWEATPRCLLALIKKHKSSAYNLLRKRSGALDDDILAETMLEWKSWLFRDLPLSHIVRVVDCFLVEGHKFLMRAAIAVVYMWSKIQKAKLPVAMDGSKNTEEKIAELQAELASAATQCTISTETFIEMAVLIKNLKSSTIARMQGIFEKKVRDEQSRNSARRASTNVYCYTSAFASSIISKDTAKLIMARFPSRLQLVTPVLLFKLSQDGASFTHLWSKVDEADQTLLVIRTAKGDIFGAYCSSCWAERNDRRERTKSKYFGTGESFVFRMPVGRNEPEIYGWVGNNSNGQSDNIPQMFMTANDKLIVIGSGDGDAIRICDELTRGISSACATFGSPELVPDRAFDINELEVFGVMANN